MSEPEVQTLQESPQPDASRGPDYQAFRREVTDFFKMVVWFLIIFVALRSYVVEGYEVQGTSMDPNLQDNERILVFKLPHKLSQFRLFQGRQVIDPGDIIVFDSPDNSNKRYVKRVIAMGDTAHGNTVDAESEAATSRAGVHVQFDRGDVYVDNQKVDQSYLQEKARISADKQELTLAPGEYYVLGDNRRVSKDSRSFNAIHDRAIIGKAVIRFWPPNRVSLLQ